MRALLPEVVAVAEMRGSDAPDPLFAEEARAVRGAVAARRREFAAGRTCARRALHQIGYDQVAILPRPDRSPRWPAGAVGSITHCARYCAAAVAPSHSVASLGIDAEPCAPLPGRMVERIAYGTERGWIAARAERPWDRTLFCAKESIYKAWHSLTETWLDFDDVVVEFDERTRSFVGDVRVCATVAAEGNLAPRAIHGRYRHTDDLILAAAWIPRPSRVGEKP